MVFIVTEPYRKWYLLFQNPTGSGIYCFRTIPEVVFTVTEPYRKYTIWCRAFNLKNEGNSSTPIQVMSDVADVAGPGIMLLHEDNLCLYKQQSYIDKVNFVKATA
jgi:hypothetical protein